MKGIDILIVFMFILVLASGAYFGYTLYTQSPDDTSGEENNDTNNDDNNIFCVDNDGDGYGQNCALGEDCDDQDPEKNVNCDEVEKLDMTLTFAPTTDKETYSLGEEIIFKVKAQDVSEIMTLDAINLRVSYDATILEYFEMTDLNSAYKAIPLETENNIIRIDLVNEDMIKNNDEILSLVFKPIKAGLADIRLSDDTRVVNTNISDDSKDAVEYEIKTSSISVEIVAGSEPTIEETTTTSVQGLNTGDEDTNSPVN